MKFISSSNLLKVTFQRLLREYSEYYWTIAWAGCGHAPFRDLIRYKDRVKKLVVGIHFYQTSPNFIGEFVNNPICRFIQQPNGTFHPKVYLFYNHPDHWELIIGSANFTGEAFGRNTEACVLYSNSDDYEGEILKGVHRLLNTSWKEGKVFTSEDLEQYRITWSNQRPKLQSLSGQYNSGNNKPKPIHLVPIINRRWGDFIEAVEGERLHGLSKRLRVINIAQDLFNSVGHFDELKTEQRKFIAGIPNKLDLPGAENWGYFGSMDGSGVYKNKVINNNKNLSLGLDQIPLKGPVTLHQFENFIFHYEKVFVNTHLESANKIATATRLLCMKRPDTFICLDSKNSSALCKDFNISKYLMTYNRYWNEIIMRIQDSEWWQNPNPMNDVQRSVSEARAAFLDSIYYKP